MTPSAGDLKGIGPVVLSALTNVQHRMCRHRQLSTGKGYGKQEPLEIRIDGDDALLRAGSLRYLVARGPMALRRFCRSAPFALTPPTDATPN
jgi:hypothetical protein